jgi:hypothetical protein
MNGPRTHIHSPIPVVLSGNARLCA